jgi:hypothetical protein
VVKQVEDDRQRIQALPREAHGQTIEEKLHLVEEQVIRRQS